MDDVAVPFVDPLKTDLAAQRLVVGLTKESMKSTAAVYRNRSAQDLHDRPPGCFHQAP